MQQEKTTAWEYINTHRAEAPQKYHLLVGKHLHSNSASDFKYLYDLRQTMLLPSSHHVSVTISYLRMWSVLYIHTCKKACLKDLKNQQCKKRQQRCSQTADSTSSLIHIPLFCASSDFSPPLLIFLQVRNTGACKERAIFEINLRKGNRLA